MAELYLETQRIRIQEFEKMLVGLSMNDSSRYGELQAEFNTLAALPKNIKSMININKKDLLIQSLFWDFTNQCRITQSLLTKIIFEIHKQNYNNSYNLNFNYLYNNDENLKGTEIYVYDINIKHKHPH